MDVIGGKTGMIEIDCEKCTAPNYNPNICQDCVVNSLLEIIPLTTGNSENSKREPTTLVEEELTAISHLAQSGLLPPIRYAQN